MGTVADLYQFQYGKGNNNPDNGGVYPVYGSNGIIGGFDEYNAENSPVIGHIVELIVARWFLHLGNTLLLTMVLFAK